MTQSKIALLPDRSIVRVAGEDAEKLLQGIITNDMSLLADQPAIYAGLLTPQGKVLFEFFVVRSADGFLLETGSEQAEDLSNRLGMYKLRAKVTIYVSGAYRVAAVWGGQPLPAGHHSDPDSLTFLDPRQEPGLGLREVVPLRAAGTNSDPSGAWLVSAEAYHAHRIALGVPEGGKDYAFGEAFPHEANFDALSGISFTKGCFVGQEVVSRTQHRGITRKRIVIVEGEHPLQSGAEVMAGPAAIGQVGSVAGNRGLALLRLDRAEEAIGKGERLTAAGREIRMRVPDYLKPAREAAAS